ncbi:MAG TPA: branched-chain amino acid ABC transporter permease [Spirochaetota bacterium]|nr:branched-chain amino acid ABC transporter permease [Spirochaetota bacterium]HOM38001.1 branched-chain amino acid ABC transporter permease [Spirochaetota bacterium]HPQ48805.1 branched-chain amino acid ABC transporter permease [Spirochaetota bacterium]
MSVIFYLGSILKNIGLIVFIGATIFVFYLAFKDTLKRGLFCFIPSYHLYYALEKLRHPWKKNINRVLWGGFWGIIIGYVFMNINSFSGVVNAIINGSISGSYFALMAFAIILIFRTTDLVNFAQADMASYSVFFVLTLLGEHFITAIGLPEGGAIMPIGIAIVLALLLSGAFGVFTETVFIKPVQKQHPISQIILTLGLGMFYTNLAAGQLYWDQEEHRLPEIIGGNIKLGESIAFPIDGILSLVVTVLIMLVIFALFKYTLLGIALRATAQSQTTSRLMGINVNMVFIMSWAISVMLGGLAGIFYLAGKTINLYSTANLMLKGFSAAILGGFSSLPGAVLGGFLLGIIDYVLGLITNIKEILSFLIILIVLIVKPEGLLVKTKTVKKV